MERSKRQKQRKPAKNKGLTMCSRECQ